MAAVLGGSITVAVGEGLAPWTGFTSSHDFNRARCLSTWPRPVSVSK